MSKWMKWLLALLVLAGLALVGCQALTGSDKAFTVSQERLQKMVNRNWTSVAEKMNKYNVQIAAPTINLQPNEQRIGANFDAFIDLGLLKVEGVMHVSGVPAYSESKGAVMLNDMRVDQFEAKGLPDGLVKSQAQKMITKTFGLDVPIYEMPPEKLSFAGKKWIPQTIEVQRDGLRITLQPK
ncbi:MAG: DUF1439 domain-containing protein [Formosimonas sp.]